ncbi:MAG: transcription elongation factor GreA [Elusimicrobia bacterium]|nr:transcription elongation factor GreA [Elusimicrobiota bacterium]
MGETYITRNGYHKLQKDLEDLKKQKKVLSGEIDEARQKGDLKENAEYHSAKERLGEVMGRIGKIEEQLTTARMIDDIAVKKDEVQIGVKVTLEEKDSREEYEWTLVGPAESDPSTGRISVHAPLAQGLLGHKVGEEVRVDLPAGMKTFKILRTVPAL